MELHVWSDIACPWCAIGKARLDRALAGFPHRDHVTVRWQSFELDPTAPRRKEGDYGRLLAAKYRTSVEDAQAMIDRMVDTAAADGLIFRFDLVEPGNTFDAHRVLHLAADRGRQHQVKERLLTGYLSEGAAIGDPDVVRGLATEGGLDDVEVKEVIAGDRYEDAVRADEREAAELGIRAVPTFVFDRRFAVQGAQPVDVLRGALEQAWGAETAEAHAGHDAAACADGSCSA